MSPWWQSRGVIGALMSIAASIVTLAGYTMDVAVATELAVSLFGLVGGALAWWGRVNAQAPISRTKILPNVTLF